jgi:hypothetical protein
LAVQATPVATVVSPSNTELSSAEVTLATDTNHNNGKKIPAGSMTNISYSVTISSLIVYLRSRMAMLLQEGRCGPSNISASAL